MDTLLPTLSRRAAHPGLRRLASVVLMPFVLMLGACVSEPSAVTGEKQRFGYSWEQEQQLGAEADKEISAEMGLYDNPAVQSYVESVGQRVLQQSALADPKTPEMYRNTKFTFRVMDSPVVNAFALPGGYVYVTLGLLSHVQNEAQLAVVLGHEIGHVVARHSSQQAKRAQVGQIGLIAAAILGQKVLGDRVGNMGDLVNMGGQALELFMMRYSREAEHESDSLGVTWAQRAGYSAAESARFFNTLQRLAEGEGKALPSWQSTHPDPGDRANRVRQLAAQTPTASGAAPMVGEEEFLRRIEGLVVGDDPREGFTQNGVFYHPTLQFQFPVAPGWKVNNQKSAVVMADPNGRALMGLRLAPGNRARDAAAQFAQKAGVQVVSGGDTTINGMPATVIIGQAQTEQGTVGVWNAFVEMDNRVYSFLGYSPAQVFSQMRPTFEAVAGGFGRLRDGYAMNVQPARLKLVRADRSAPLASFIPTSLPRELTADKVAIMNQLNLNEPVPEGRILKVPDTSVQPTMQPGYAPQQPHPAAGYPPPQAYPPQSYPPQAYPPAQTYPPAQYPPQQGYPPQPYPPQQPYPQQHPYPQQQPYPQQYPPQPYPPPPSQQSYPYPANPPPNWPR